jgi:hypothetical protein
LTKNKPLGPALEATQIARLKELYVFLHPETKHGGDRKSVSQIAKLKSEDRSERFAKVEVANTGKNEATIARAAARATIVLSLEIKIGPLAPVIRSLFHPHCAAIHMFSCRRDETQRLDK